jgi:DNA-binding transcriptional LysR family regulator
MPVAGAARIGGMSTATVRGGQDRWLGVEVRHLAALRAVAEEGTFGAAALRLGYAQSAISQQIAALERNVGHRLFDRPGGSRPVTLTRAGELLLGHAEAITTRLAAARIDLDSLGAEDVVGPLRVGAFRTVAPAMLPAILRELGADPDEVELALTESSDDAELLRLLADGELDLAFTEAAEVDGALELSPLLDDPYVLVVGELHPYAALGRELTLEEVAAVPLVGLKRGTALPRIDDAFAIHGLRPRFAQRVEDGATLHGFVGAGIGAGLVPRLAADVDGKPLVALPIESRLPARTVSVAWHRDRLRTCTAGLFVDLACEVAGLLDDAR